MHTPSKSSTLDRVRDRLRHRYLDSLPGKIFVLEQSLSELNDVGGAEATNTARRLAHQIRGSAASFGFADLGILAAAVEEAADTELGGNIERLVERMRQTGLEHSAQAASILIVDDEPTTAELIASLISAPNRSVRLAGTCGEARAQLSAEYFDLVILDLILPDGDGRDLLTEIREDPRTQYTAIIVLSAKTASLVKNECSIYGVDAFIEKPVVGDLIATLIATTLQRRREFRREALNDDLTKLNNRGGFRIVFDQMHALAKRGRLPLSVALLDLDRFKAINDRYGHEAGDLALVEFATVMKDTLRSSDALGRWGGEEFIIAFPDTTAEAACIALRKLASALREQVLPHGVTLTFSAGVVECAPHESLDLALLRADQLLYAAKGQGRDLVLLHADPKTGAERILVVEDDPETAALLAQALRDVYSIVHATDARSALEAAAREAFALVILDYNLPDGDGVAVLKELRKLPNYVTKPIVMLTGAASDNVVEAAFAAGADDYIVKPFRPRALRSRIQRRLERP